MSRNVYSVMPAGAGWRVKREGARRAAALHRQKSDALARAKALAKRSGLGQVKVHRRNGEIEAEFTYGKDPRRTAG
ncbi:MAG TPA: DUF2188 domain-containing protein [Polyangiaceae bacterium]|nr:DUF2188 domain-containing protein [Polyangiaceae bacterium]